MYHHFNHDNTKKQLWHKKYKKYIKKISPHEPPFSILLDVVYSVSNMRKRSKENVTSAKYESHVSI